MSVILDRALAEGSSLQLTLVLTEDGIEHADEPAFESEAIVVWAAPTDAGQTMLGLRFSQLEPDRAQHLTRFLRALGK